MDTLTFNLKVFGFIPEELPDPNAAAWAMFLLATCLGKTNSDTCNVTLGEGEIAMAVPYEYKITVELVTPGQRFH